MSSSEPASRFWSMTKYNPRVEMSRVLPCCESSVLSVGIRMMIGKDKSYRRVVRRSVIPPILEYAPRICGPARVPFSELNLLEIYNFVYLTSQATQLHPCTRRNKPGWP